MVSPLHLRPLEKADLETVLRWRNRPEVRENMFTRHEISAAEHISFFDRALVDPTRRFLLGVDQHKGPVGLVTFSDIDELHATASWGLYTGESASRGTGTWLGLLALTRGFEELGLMKVSAEVLDWNTRSLRFHQLLGFRVEGIFRAQHTRAGVRHDVYRLGLLESEWRLRRPDIEARLRRPMAARHPLEPGARRALKGPCLKPRSDFVSIARDAVRSLDPRPATLLDRIDVRFHVAQNDVQEQDRNDVEVVRRVGRHVTASLTCVASGDDPTGLHATIDFTLPEEET